jgi:pyruvate ferredoxin oxidoreductase beta subunit
MSTTTQETPLTLKALSKKEERFVSGHRMCAGCGAPTIVRQIMLAIDEPVIAANATGCLEVSSCIYPYTSWKMPWIHSAFENSAATASGVEAMYRSLKKQGKYDKNVKFLAFGGDGGTYDIGFQSLSGAMERGNQLLYICYDNGAYMNTGIQRSSATPYGADTSTCPVGTVVPGKPQRRKDLTRIMAAHGAYAAQASPSNWKDLMTKVRKAIASNGPAYIGIISPCNRGWRTQLNDSILMSRLAVDTCYWPLYEVEEKGKKLSITYDPKDKKKPVVDFLKPQGRFKHLFAPGNEHMLVEFQKMIDEEWEFLKKMQDMSKS